VFHLANLILLIHNSMDNIHLERIHLTILIPDKRGRKGGREGA
jgi:hypothetical protein